MASRTSKRLVPVCVTSSWLSLSLDRDKVQRGRDVPPVVRGWRRCTGCEVSAEAVHVEKDAWGFWRLNPIARKAEQDRINAYKRQEQAQKEAAQASLHELVTKSDVYELEIARVNVDNAGLRKENERLQRENQRLQTFKQLGESRLQKALREGQSRSGKIAWSIMSTCSFIDKEDAAVLAKGIDFFEDFDHPQNLKAEVVSSSLQVSWGYTKGGRQWRTQYGMSRLTQTEQETLLAAVAREIVEQKALFPVRAQIKQTCERHLQGALCIGSQQKTPAELHHYMRNAKDKNVVARKMHKELVDRFERVFKELANNHIDVEATLLDSWKPLELLHATWLHAFLQGCERPGEPLRAEWKIPAEEVTKEAWSLWDAFCYLNGSDSSSVSAS